MNLTNILIPGATVVISGMTLTSIFNDNERRAWSNIQFLDEMITSQRGYLNMIPENQAYVRRTYTLELDALGHLKAAQSTYLERPWYGKLITSPPFPDIMWAERYAHENNYQETGSKS